ncbi:hypothetical protein Pla175_02030 [Pirellulimonas nuda]|uniref:Oligosaccharide repeat unit polymerase n=1 Tax=Pirellulimonas nuda TaxID=2528009 RepID=A0A518D5V9_9BACT|nr:hypothetical protein [Pirellulimonas nuda]QDU86850.1 hypothetical protein Pla175_02030 [Pirellulimonas nuda]
MQSELYPPFLAVTALSLAGLLRFPKAFIDLLRPRFVIPGLVWVSTAGNAINYQPHGLTVIASAYDEHAVMALWFVAVCLAVFWIGYVTPIGKWIGEASPELTFHWNTGATSFFIATLFCATLVLINPFVAGYFGPVGRIISRFSMACVFGGPAALGLYLGSNPRVGLMRMLFAVASIAVFTTPLMASFSRGTGLPLLVCFVSFSFARQRIRVVPAILCLALAAYLGMMGLSGRGAAGGHYAGALAYLKYIAAHPIPSFSGASSSGVLLHDSLTPLCVAMESREQQSTLTGTLSPRDWLLNQLPVPRSFGLPDWNVNLGKFVSGTTRTSWGYTMSSIGDLYLHFGSLGSIGFLFMGIFYRFVGTVTFRNNLQWQAHTVDWYSLLLLASYYAFVLGLYNTYRGWLTLCLYALYALFGIFLVRLVLGGKS